jgi:hypothetical protein
MNTKEEKPDSGLRISKEFLSLFLVLAVSCIFMHSFVAPLREEAELIKLEIAIKEKNIESRELWLSRVVKLNEKNEANLEDIKKINSLVPNRNNYEDYLAHIIKLAGNKNVIVDGFSVSENQKKGNNNGLNSIKISFSASGGYSNFISFLEDIERSIPFTQVGSVAVTGSESDQDAVESGGIAGSIIDFSVELSFNYY